MLDYSGKCPVFRIPFVEASHFSLCRFEKIKNFRILLDPFTTENQMMTPTFKLRRFVFTQALGE